MKLSTLAEWLDWIGSVHSFEIDLGLERIRAVADRLGLLSPACPVIIVGGTNGKGSTAAALESIYQEAGYHTGVFSSPVLLKHNEYVRIDGQEAGDEAFCEAYERITEVMDTQSPTPFEFHTLAALWLFRKEVESHPKAVLILEVGLGGRLDAVNILDADVAIVTSIDIDHSEWLGDSREAIGIEKAGIFRKGKFAIVADPHPPKTLLDHAQKIESKLICQGRDFNYQEREREWIWQFRKNPPQHFPVNSLITQNMAAAVTAVYLLQDKWPVSQQAIESGLEKVKLPARIEVIEGEVTEIHDAAHNPAAISRLAAYIKKMPCNGKRFAVFSMLSDKDIEKSILEIKNEIDEWFIAPLSEKRAACKEQLIKAFEKADVKTARLFETISDAYSACKKAAAKRDAVIVFGSFHTISEIRKS